MSWNTLITNARAIVQIRDRVDGPIKGNELNSIPTIDNGYVAIKDGRIASLGSMNDLPSNSKADEIIDATGGFVLPAFVDSHTHLVFAASREEEFVMKIKGASYADIAAKGGGILNSAKKLQQMSEEELFERSMVRAKEIMLQGTGAVEIKSGYGLTVKDELKMLRVAKRIGAETPLTVKTTFLGAHAVPKEVSKEDYLKIVIEEMIPAVAEEKLADYIDVFCETGFFTQYETERIVEAGKAKGMRPRIHANQLNKSGGVQAGINTGAVSVDHLENIGEEEIELLKQSDVIPTALPGAAFFLNLPYPPARQMINEGLPLALASDYNPGSSPTGNMRTIMSLACIGMRMTPVEALNATTVNTACAMEIHKTHGSLGVDKVASIIITKKIPSLEFIPYAFGSDFIDSVILAGKRITAPQ